MSNKNSLFLFLFLFLKKVHIPSTPRENRLCTLCETVEDEHHVIFHCPRFDDVRRTHVRLLQQYQTVGEMLNPNFANMNNVAGMLHDIEDRYKELKLWLDNNFRNIFGYSSSWGVGFSVIHFLALVRYSERFGSYHICPLDSHISMILSGDRYTSQKKRGGGGIDHVWYELFFWSRCF